MKTCPKCRKNKDDVEFGVRSNSVHLRSHCKECEAESATNYYHSHQEQAVLYRENNRETLRERVRRQYAAHTVAIGIKHAEKGYAKQPRYRYGAYKRNAIRRHYEWCLSFEEFMFFWQSTCFYCGDPIETIGLDRLDNTKGYIKDNVVSCCPNCNIAKFQMSVADFVTHIRKIATNLKDFVP